ncbi:DUF1186 domain-containing protein [Pontiellaceae bacterium B1224]|nr:DUF1186 domain-containing protein [Pontiellaceae bacterium B1224]
MTTEEALQSLEPFTATIPVEALNTIRTTWPEAEAALLAELDERIEHPYMDDRSARFLYALFLLAELKSAAAFDRYLTLLQLPEKMVDQIFGDILTESSHHLLANTCHGRFDDLKALVENSHGYEFARSQGVYALLELVHTGAFPRADMESYCMELLSEKLKPYADYIWDTVITACDALSMKKALPLIRQAYERHLADPFVQSLESIEKALAQQGEGAELRLSHIDKLGSTEEEIVFYTEHWGESGGPKDPDFTDLLTAPATVRQQNQRTSRRKNEPGRNEPCPCGSGKKYKKCCITTGYIRDKACEAEPEKGPKNRTDEWIMAGHYYDKDGQLSKALACWQKAWSGVRDAIPAAITDPDDAACNTLFNGFDFLSNWLQDVETAIDRAASDSLRAIQFGMDYFPAVLQRFPAMNPHIVGNFGASLARLECACGRSDAAFERLQQMIDTNPDDAQAYAVWADLLSFDAERFNLPLDIVAAQQLLIQAKLQVKNADDWGIDSRIEKMCRWND